MATIDSISSTRRPEGFWDGVTNAYIPERELRVPEALKLSRTYAEDVDPISYEVIRHALWNANMEHMRTIENLAVSPVTVEIRDFQPCILTEDGELLYFGPCLQYFSGVLDVVTKYIIEHRGERIRDGDMWLQNDPVIGTPHQPDVALVCPVFVDGEVFCWVANMAHMNDIGGTVPGSFCTNAADVFWDPVSIPPVRMVSNGQIDPDLEQFYRRCSRTPDALSLDLRATIAGNHAARARIVSLVERYGKDVVKGVMKRILDASQSQMEKTLDTIPDGEYRCRTFQEIALTGDRGTYPVATSVRKVGRQLTFSNEGTHGQVGAINVGFAAWRGAILAAINVLMLPDQMGCVGGGARCCSFDPEPGTMTCPDANAAVSPAGMYMTEMALSLAGNVIGQMMLASTDTAVRDRALLSEASQWQIHFLAGENQRGDYYVAASGEGMFGATGPTWRQDGVFANGHWWIPEGRGPNVESYERDWPILYLFRREHQDSGGAGRFRAGNGGELAYVPHGGASALAVYTTEAIPKSPGMYGGDPGAIGRSRLLTGTDVRDHFARGRTVDDLGELTGEEVELVGKGPAHVIGDHDVLYWNWAGPGGYGDPLTRDPERVAVDVRSGAVSLDAARRTYGVVMLDGHVDPDATGDLRHELLASRLALGGGDRRTPRERAAWPEGTETVADVYVIDRDSGEMRCHVCGEALGSLDANPKTAMVMRETQLDDAGFGLPQLQTFVDDDVRWREFFCRGCGTRLATELAYPGEEPQRELRIT